MAASDNLLLVRWDQHEAGVLDRLYRYFADNAFVDVTLWCPDRRFKAHRVLLSACSDYLERVLLDHPCCSTEPVTVVLHGVEPDDLGRLLDLMYKGEAHVSAGDLPRFLETAAALGVRVLQSAALRVCAAHPDKAADCQQQKCEVKPHVNISKRCGQQEAETRLPVSTTCSPLQPVEATTKKDQRPSMPKHPLSAPDTISPEATGGPKPDGTSPLPSQSFALPKMHATAVAAQDARTHTSPPWSKGHVPAAEAQSTAMEYRDFVQPPATSQGDHLGPYSEHQHLERAVGNVPHSTSYLNHWHGPFLAPMQVVHKPDIDTRSGLFTEDQVSRTQPSVDKRDIKQYETLATIPAAADGTRQPVRPKMEALVTTEVTQHHPGSSAFDTQHTEAGQNEKPKVEPLWSNNNNRMQTMDPLRSPESCSLTRSATSVGGSPQSDDRNHEANQVLWQTRTEHSGQDLQSDLSQPQAPENQQQDDDQSGKQRTKHNSCADCGKIFTTRYSLKEHMRTHTGEKPHLCAQCGKRFSQRRNYRYHLSLHSGSREFAAECPECGKVFSNRSYLSSHMKIHRNQREYACEVCGRRFNQRVAYNMHARIHSGDRPHRCSICDKAFSRKVLLKQHMRIHTGEKPFTCQVCDKQFADRSNMALHARSHWGIKPYQCSHCGRSFSRRNNLRSHMVSHLTGVELEAVQGSMDMHGTTQQRRQQLRSTSVIIRTATATRPSRSNHDYGRLSSAT